MTSHGRDFALRMIKNRQLDQNNGYENITIRLDKKEWAMFVVLTKYFNLKSNGVFTDILSHDVADMVSKLKEDDFSEFQKKFKIKESDSGAKLILLKNAIINEDVILFDLESL